jgi:hypothetical protein
MSSKQANNNPGLCPVKGQVSVLRVLTKVYLFECTFVGRCNVGVPSALGHPHATRSHMHTYHRRLIFAVKNVVDRVQIDSIFDCNSLSP